MEVEFNRRSFTMLILVIALVGGAFIALPRLHDRYQADEELAGLKATQVPERQKVVASDLEINFENQSSWQIEGVEECLPLLNAWLSDYSLQQLTIVMTDTVTDDMVIGVRQSGKDAPDASVTGMYQETDQGLKLVITVEEGQPGSANLDVAVTVETALLVQEYFRPKTKETWRNRQNGLEQFQPLIHKEGDEWKSNCLHLTR